MLDDPEHVEFAIKTIYERVFGKPPQDVNLANKDGLPFQVIFSTPEKKRGE